MKLEIRGEAWVLPPATDSRGNVIKKGLKGTLVNGEEGDLNDHVAELLCLSREEKNAIRFAKIGHDLYLNQYAEIDREELDSLKDFFEKNKQLPNSLKRLIINEIIRCKDETSKVNREPEIVPVKDTKEAK